MKRKLSVELFKNGSENDVLTRLVANVNEGKSSIEPLDIMGYLETRKATYPTVSDYKYKEEGYTLYISEDGGKSYTMAITWKEVYELELQNEQENDLKDVL